MSFLAIPMPFARSSTGVPSTASSPCLENDPNCDLIRYLIGLVIFIGFIAVLVLACRAALRLMVRKRTTRPAETDTDVIYPREDQRARRSHQNFGFIDPPPRYEQIFKRDGGPPTVVTTRESPSVTMSSGEPSLPPSYEQAEIHARRTSHVTLPQSTFREVPISSIDMEHPVMAPPSADVLDMASEIANIQNHAFACVHRYDSRHADEIQRTAAAVSSTDSSSNALPELEAPEGGPPGYDAISLASEAISAR